MIAARSALRALADICAVLVLSAVLVALHWLDSSASQFDPSEVRHSLIDPISFTHRPDQIAEQGTLPDSSADLRTTDPEGPALTYLAPNDAVEGGPAAVVEREHKSLPRTFGAQQLPTSTIPAAPPILPEQLERPKLSEQVTFFKLEAKATAVVFLVDASGSMAGSRFERAQAELARAIGELNPYQSFAVAFFNQGYAFMPISNSKKPVMSKSTSDTKANAIRLMQQVSAVGGTNPEPAINVAANLRPQVIFLLTDGEFPPISSQTFRVLSENNIQVFTIGFDSVEARGTLEQISAQTGGEFRAATASEAPHEMFLAKSAAVLAALDNPDPKIRLAATIVTFSREMTYVRRTRFDEEKYKPSAQELAFVRKIPLMLNDPNDRVRQEVHHRLVLKALGTNFGPSNSSDPDDVVLAVECWKNWCRCFFEKDWREVVESLNSNDPGEQWAAASVVRIAGWEIPDDLIANLERVSMEARQEIRAALKVISDGKDFGPEARDNDEQVARATEKWRAWRAAEKLRLREEQAAIEEKQRMAALQKKLDNASARLRVADMHWKSGKKEKARTLWEKIIKEFADTPAAIEAEKRLQNSDF